MAAALCSPGSMLLKCLSFNFNSLDQEAAARQQEPNFSFRLGFLRSFLAGPSVCVSDCLPQNLSLLYSFLLSSCVLIKWYFRKNSSSPSQRYLGRRMLQIQKKSIGEEGVRVKFGFLVANLLHTNFTHLLSAANGLTKRLQKGLRNKQRLCQIVFHFRYFSKFYFLCLIIFHEKFPLFRDRQLVWLFHR